MSWRKISIFLDLLIRCWLGCWLNSYMPALHWQWWAWPYVLSVAIAGLIICVVFFNALGAADQAETDARNAELDRKSVAP